MMKKIVLVLMIFGGMFVSGCDLVNTTNDKSKDSLLLALLLTSAATNQGSLSITSSGSTVQMTSPSGFRYTGGAYVGSFLKDVSNTVMVSWTGPHSITPQTLTKSSSGFSFTYVKNGQQYDSSFGTGFTFTISSVSGNKATGSFNGNLKDVFTNPITVSGTFTSVTFD